MEIPMLFGGQVMAEQVFSWPGCCLDDRERDFHRDYPVIMGVCLLSWCGAGGERLLTDIFHTHWWICDTQLQ